MKTISIKVSMSDVHANNNRKLEAFFRIETRRKHLSEIIDFDKEREEAMDEKYGTVTPDEFIKYLGN